MCLVNDGYLWIEETILVMTDLTHQISRFPIKGNNPAAIAGKSSNFALAEAMKAKYKMEKRKQGYLIASMKDQGVHIATHMLVGKLMRKFYIDELPVSIIALSEQCTEGVQFNWAQFLCNEFLTNCREAQE